MTDENVDAGSQTSGEQAADTTATEQSDTVADTATDAGAEASKDAAAATDAGGDAVQEKGETLANPEIGDACTCPDGRPGTIQAGSEEGTIVCLPNGN
jgi:hypothetical protein